MDNPKPVASEVSTTQLLGAIKRFLVESASPALSGRDRFNARVSANVLGIIERETALGPQLAALDRDALAKWLPKKADGLDAAQAFARALASRSIAPDSALLSYLQARQLLVCAINNPRYASVTVAQSRWHKAVAKAEVGPADVKTESH